MDYSVSGIKDLLRRIGASYHKVSGFFWKADVEEQKWTSPRMAGAGLRVYPALSYSIGDL